MLGALYPYMGNQNMANQTASKPSVADALATSIAQKVSESLAAKEAFFNQNADQLVAAAQIIADAYSRNNKLLCAGNGGSSCDAAHLAVEFMHPVTAGRPALPAINLSQDTTMASAVANDVGFEHVLTRQLIALSNADDVLVVFTTSGNSANLIKACKKAQSLGLKVIAFAGGDGGALVSEGCTDICLAVDTDSIHRIQECHLTAYHILWDLVHTLLADQRGSLQTS